MRRRLGMELPYRVRNVNFNTLTLQYTDKDTGHQAEKTTSHASESSKTAASPSPSGEEKSEKKMDKLKDKLKNKLHIGSKDK
jgi:hypothetical protein